MGRFNGGSITINKNIMAVSVDTVYQRVLAILNKEQRGYLTPEEYNLFANQAQMDIFEQYFYDINQFDRMHGNSTEYSDMIDLLNKKIGIFEKTANLGNYDTDHYNLPSDMYRLGSVIYSNAEAERISQKEWLYINSSPIAQPTNTFPVYTRNEDGIQVRGTATITDNDAITCNYIKVPSKVIWNYTTVLGNAQYTATGSVNFELHNSEETELVIKILALAGLLVQDVGMYQVASAEETKDIQQQKA